MGLVVLSFPDFYATPPPSVKDLGQIVLSYLIVVNFYIYITFEP